MALVAMGIISALILALFGSSFKQIAGIVEQTEEDFVARNQLAFGDIYLANWFDIYEDVVDKCVLDGFPCLKNLQQAVMNLPAIKSWIERRPTSIAWKIFHSFIHRLDDTWDIRK